MITLLKINGHDYTHWIEDGGYEFSRDDLDSSATGRTKNGTMRRVKICEKRNLTFALRPVPESIFVQLDNDLHAATFDVTYHDPHGDTTRQFYCSQLPGKMTMVVDEGNIMWSGVSFSIHEC